VPPLPWPSDPVGVLGRLSPSAQEGGALALWAAWCVEALDYAVEIDNEFYGQSKTRGFHPDVIDLAHVRWCAGTASTAIDLCAAALGSWYCGVQPGEHQLDLRQIRPWAKKRLVSRRRAQLPRPARAWVRRVWVDPHYKTLLAARNPFTHSRLPRHLTRPRQGHHGRTEFPIPRKGDAPTSSAVGSRTLVLLARDVARRHVQEFLNQIEAQHLGP
jgi:hypothetical protein